MLIKVVLLTKRIMLIKIKTKIWIFHEKLNLNDKEIGDIDDENKSNIIDKNDNVDENDQNENEI